jgi:hypothetical protein
MFRSEPFACLLGAHRRPLAEVLLGLEEPDEFVAVERRELHGVPKRVPDELAPAVETAPLPRIVDLVEERLGDFEIHSDDFVLSIPASGCIRHTGVIWLSYV